MPILSSSPRGAAQSRTLCRALPRPRALPWILAAALVLSACGASKSPDEAGGRDDASPDVFSVAWDGPPPEEAELMGDLDSNTPMRVTVALEHDSGALTGIVESNRAAVAAGEEPTYLDSEGIVGQVSQDESVAAVRKWIDESGVRGEVSGNGLFATLDLTAAQAEELFGVDLGTYELAVPGGEPVRIMASEKTPSMPAELSDHVRAVVGLRSNPRSFASSGQSPSSATTTTSTTVAPSGSSTSSSSTTAPPSTTATTSTSTSSTTSSSTTTTTLPPVPHTGTAKGCSGALATNSFTPNQLVTAYGVDELHGSGLEGEGGHVVIASTEIDGATLDEWAACFGLPAVSQKVQVHATVPSELKMIEGYMDIQGVLTFAPSVERIDFFNLPVSFTGLPADPYVITALTAATETSQMGGSLPDAISVSMQDPEATLSSSTIDSYETALKADAAAGIAVVFSAGDYGSHTMQITEPSDYVGVAYPASSQYVTSAGGTEMSLHADNSVASQFVWNNSLITKYSTPASDQAGGGGVSTLWSIPGYQQGAPGVPEDATKRLQPDMAILAGYSGLSVLSVTGEASPEWSSGGGTSLSAPLTAGLFVLLNQGAGERLGEMNPRLYAAANSDYGKYFADITEVSNKIFPSAPCCDAGPQYDMASGLGVPKPAALLEYLKANPTAGATTGSSGG